MSASDEELFVVVKAVNDAIPEDMEMWEATGIFVTLAVMGCKEMGWSEEKFSSSMRNMYRHAEQGASPFSSVMRQRARHAHKGKP